MDVSLMETVARQQKSFYLQYAIKINRHLTRQPDLLSNGWSDRHPDWLANEWFISFPTAKSLQIPEAKPIG